MTTLKLDSMRKLFVDQLRDIYNAETQLTKALKEMADSATDQELKAAFEDHLHETEQHVDRLEKVFKSLDYKPEGEVCDAMKGLISEGKDLLKEKGDPEVKDAGLIIAAQKVEHYEIATYGSLVHLAKLLDERETASTLEETLKEEKAADAKLNDIAINRVNREAMTA